MPPSSKRTKRLLLIAGVAVGLGLAGGGVYLFRQRQMDQNALDARDKGRTALLAGDYPAALDGVGSYIIRFRQRGAVTSEDYLQYSKARRKVEAPNGQHMVGAVANLRKALELDPKSRPVQDELLECYLEIGFATEAVELLDSMLSATPSDVKLLRTKCDLLEAIREFPKALEVARRVHELEPDDLAGPVRTLRLMIRSGTSAQNVDLWLAAVTTAHPDDARFDLLRAAAYTRRGEKDKAKEVLDRIVAAVGAPKDPKFLALLIGELDAAERFADSLRVIEQIEATDDLSLRRECVRRLWYAERYAEALERAERWTVDVASADAEMLGLRAVVLVGSDRKPEAEPLRKELAGRTDALGKAWSSYVEHALREGASDPSETVRALAEAARAEPDSAILLLSLGDARAALGESDAAVQTWAAASSFAPSWARPLCRIAEALRRTGRPAHAVSAARGAMLRAPTKMESISTWLRTMGDLAAKLDEKQVASLLASMEGIRKDVPQAASDLLPIEASLLLRTDKRRAATLLLEIVEAPAGASEDTLLRLAQLSVGADPSLEARFFDTSEKLFGVTPRLALARAVVRARTAGVDAGLRVIDDLRGRADKTSPSLDWDVIRATYMDTAGHPGAGPAWIGLADANPSILTPQLGALSCGAAWRDPAAIDRIIERVKTATGDMGVSWRTARARRLLNDAASAQPQFEEAQKILDEAIKVAPGNIAARLLAAQALERVGNVDAAEEQLRAAAALQPDDASTSLEIARLAQGRGKTDIAREQLDRALASPRLGPDEIQRAAFLLAAQGDLGRSADLLQPLTAEDKLDRRGMALLVELRMRLGDYEGALQVCERLMDEPTPQVLALAAELYSIVGRGADAQAALTRLDATEAQPGDRELLRAKIASHGTDVAAAKAAFRAAVVAAPKRADAWTAYLTFAVTGGDAATLAEILDNPAAAASDRVKFFAENREVCIAALPDPRQRPLVWSAMDDEANRTVLLDAVRLIAANGSDAGAQVELARGVRVLAEANSRVLVLQLLAVDMSLAAGELRQACDVAARAMRQFTNDASTARAATDLYGQAGRWREAIEAAQIWRQRAGRRDPRPDLFLATALLQIDRAADAVTVLEPRMAPWLAQPDGFDDPILTYLLALARSKRSARAAEILADLSSRSPRWRVRPLDVRAEWLRDAAGAREWLELCAKSVPADDRDAQLRLARAWSSAWERYRSSDLLASARKLLNELAAAPDAPAEVFFIGGVLAERSGDLLGATRGYQAAIDREPKYAAARNNLAMIQAEAGQWEKAVEHGRVLVADHPRVPEFLDTLAYALRKGRKYDEAKAQMQAAIDADALNPAWRVGLAEILAESGEVAESARVVARVEEMAAAGTALPPDLRGRVDRLKARKR